MRVDRRYRGASQSKTKLVYPLVGFLVLVLGCLKAPQLAGQTSLGSITGVVNDPSGAAIPNANVTAINEVTRSRRTAPTSPSGTYQMDGLQVGTYTLEVENPGFKKYVQSGIPVGPGQLKRIDVALEVGAVTQSIEVKDVVPVLQTESPALVTRVPTVAYAAKPIVNESRGNYLFDPMVWQPGSAAGNSSFYSMAGNRPSMQRGSVEGMAHNIYWVRAPFISVGEVNVVYSNPQAEYARPVTMEATYRSGTNTLHGEWMVNLRQPCANARNTPFSRPTRWPCPSSWRHQLSIGGPVYLPKIYDGRNKTFLFFSMKRNPIWTLSTPASYEVNPTAISAPTLAMQRGDFSKYPKTIKDPVTGLAFPGNIIPSARISQFAKGYMADLMPSDYYTYVGSPDSYVNNAITQSTGFGGIGDTKMMRFDQNLGTKDILSFSMNHEVSNGALQRYATKGILGQVFGTWSFSLGYTHTLSPSVVNQFRTGYTRFKNGNFDADKVAPPDLSRAVKGMDYVQRWGLQGITPSGLSGEPAVYITGWPSSEARTMQTLDVDDRFNASEALSIVAGRHAFKMGYSVIKQIGNGMAAGPFFGRFDFDGLFTGESWADFLLGLPSNLQRFVPRPGLGRRIWEHGAYFQDDFKVNPKLTLQLGMRYDRFTAPYDKNDLYYNFDPKTFSVVVPDEKARSLVNPAWPTGTFPIKLASAVGFPPHLVNPTQKWAPRFGFAYHMTARTVLRGGFGIYTGALRFNHMQVTGPFAITENFVNVRAPGTSTGALYAMPNPFPLAAAVSVASITGFDVNYRAPYTQNWNLTFERELVRNWGLQVTYRGVKSIHLPYRIDFNEVQATTTAFSQSRRPYPALSNVFYIGNGAGDRYNALMFQINRPWVSGLHFTAAYTYSRAVSDAHVQSTDDQVAYTPEYSFDRSRDRGRHDMYPRHDIISNYVVELPFGRGKRFGSGINKVLNAFVGDYSFSGAFSWRAGWYFHPFLSGVDPGNLGKTSGRRPDLVAGCDPYAGAQDIKGLWFNPKCFATPPPGQLGNVAINSFTGPGAWVWILNPYKEFPLTFIREGMKLRFGAMIYNILNHPVYGLPTRDLSSLVAGKITGIIAARGTGHDYAGMRQVIFDMRFVY